jgi:hypothetical protein
MDPVAEACSLGKVEPEGRGHKMRGTKVHGLLKYMAVAGNILFVLWILRDGMDEGYRGTLPEMISYIALILLLALNTALLLLRERANH